MQDRDIFYHNIGHSIENAQRADIAPLGHSVLEFAIDNKQMEEFERRYHVRIFNLAWPCQRRLRTKGDQAMEHQTSYLDHQADDHPANFFNEAMDDFAARSSSVQHISKTPRVVGFFNVARRDIRSAAEKGYGALVFQKVSIDIIPPEILICPRTTAAAEQE